MEVKIGDVVRVGQRYVMADHPPYVGNGRMLDDELTGTVWRVVGLRTSKISGQRSAMLAPSNLLNVDESDEEWDVGISRLTVIE